MLQLTKAFLNKPVLSLRTGGAVAFVTAPIINPNNLKIEGFYCNDTFHHNKLVLLYQDIRDIIPKGFIIDDYDVLTDPEELVRLKDLMALNFDLMDKQVETMDKQKLGKVKDYATDTTTMYVQKLYVAQSIFKNIAGGSLSIDRTQITEITNKRIIVADIAARSTVRAGAMA